MRGRARSSSASTLVRSCDGSVCEEAASPRPRSVIDAARVEGLRPAVFSAKQDSSQRGASGCMAYSIHQAQRRAEDAVMRRPTGVADASAMISDNETSRTGSLSECSPRAARAGPSTPPADSFSSERKRAKRLCFGVASSADCHMLRESSLRLRRGISASMISVRVRTPSFGSVLGGGGGR